MAAIIVLGSLNMDIAALAPRLPQPGETLMGSHFHTAPGGKGANQAYAAAKLGRAGSTAMVGRVGDDDFGRQMIANLVATGCGSRGPNAAISMFRLPRTMMAAISASCRICRRYQRNRYHTNTAGNMATMGVD